MQVEQQRLTGDLISKTRIDSLLSSDLVQLARFLWTFLGNHMTNTLLNRRTALAGGDDRNGFELWRVLYWEHEGGTEQCHLTGARHLIAFPQCKDAKSLTARIGEWFKHRNAHGNGVSAFHLT